MRSDYQLFEKQQVQVSEVWDLIGKTVRIRRGPAAVNGDESHENH